MTSCKKYVNKFKHQVQNGESLDSGCTNTPSSLFHSKKCSFERNN